MKKLIRFLPGVLLLSCATVFYPLPESDFLKESIHSFRVLDRNATLLREFLNDQQGRGQWLTLDHIAPSLIRATIAAEDKRFRLHPGVDPFATARALVKNIRAGALRAGGSTITQQVIRNVYHHPRTLPYKALEAWYALRLERMYTKDEILEQYLNRAPYGNQLFGAEAASRFYFDKPARDLSLAEAAFLASLPNAPSVLNPSVNPQPALQRQKVVLNRMHEEGLITGDEFQRSLQQPIDIVRPEVNFRSPHLVDMMFRDVRNDPHVVSARTTIDLPLQESISWLVKGHLKSLQKKNVSNAAVVIIENASMEIAALLGSADYFNSETNGQVNGALALRQPGSSIKPFTYGVALEGRFTTSDLLADIPTHIPDDRGDYIPENYDRRYHGPVRLRTALACSYNVPAVRVLKEIGKDNLLQRLMAAGLTTLNEPSAFYGYGLTLGNGEVRLLELTQAYAALANGGIWRPARTIRELTLFGGMTIPFSSTQPARKIFDEEVSFLLTDILKDPSARKPAFGNAFRFPFPCAVKTGTTKDYRDNWTLGYTRMYTVGVWVGNFDGSPMRGVSGITGAGQIFSDIMSLLHSRSGIEYPGDFPVPAGVIQRSVCGRSGKLPNEYCRKTIREWFRSGSPPRATCDVHQAFRIEGDDGQQRTVVYEVFPSEYNEWIIDQNLELPSPGAVRVGLKESQLKESKNYFRILSPTNGSLFKVDPVLRPEYQTIRIVGKVPKEVSHVRLRVNDSEELQYEASGVWWKLRKGKHRLRLTGKRNGHMIESRTVLITVD